MLHFNMCRRNSLTRGKLSYRQDFKKDFFWYVGKLTLCVQHHYSDDLFHVFIHCLLTHWTVGLLFLWYGHLVYKHVILWHNFTAMNYCWHKWLRLYIWKESAFTPRPSHRGLSALWRAWSLSLWAILDYFFFFAIPSQLKALIRYSKNVSGRRHD